MNMLGATINSGLAILINIRGPLPKVYGKLNESYAVYTVSQKLSMISNKNLLNIHRGKGNLFPVVKQTFLEVKRFFF